MSAAASRPTPEIWTFIADVIVPALLERFLAEHQHAEQRPGTPQQPMRVESQRSV